MSIVTIFSQSQSMLIPIFRASVRRAFPYCRFHVFLALGNFVWFFATNFKPARGNLRKITHRNVAKDFFSLQKLGSMHYYYEHQTFIPPFPCRLGWICLLR